MSVPAWLSQAIADVKLLCPADVEPLLTDDEIGAICVRHPLLPSIYADPTADPVTDISGAASDCWLLKAGKVAGDYRFAEAGMHDFAQQVHEHCIVEANLLNPAGIR